MGEAKTRTPFAETLLAVAILLVLLWLTHAIAFFAHEYAHSFTAWATGWKHNPFALNYGHANFANFLDQTEIDENVDYGPIFAAHRGGAAALIAMAGVLFGNGLLYLASRYGYAKAVGTKWGTLALFFFLLVLMNVGNFISYVPIRTFATHADIATVEQGLGVSPLWLIVMPGIPFLLALVHFEDRMVPAAARTFFPDSLAWRVVLVLVCCGMLFGFFGVAGYTGYGTIATALSRLSVWVVLPWSLVLGSAKVRRTRQA